ncbi:MAG: glycoside hydrolase family 43 protein [Lachnospiraceae bacterium]|nr:glycoside hydrolase family 43 protein [Lachnospiraceae bacterium]
MRRGFTKKMVSLLLISSTVALMFAGCNSVEQIPEGETVLNSGYDLANYPESKYNVADDYWNLATNFSSHDPSIFKDEATGKYYIFGSHLTQGSSDDLMTWRPFGVQGYDNSSIYGRLEQGLAGSFAWAGYNDSDCLGGYAVWAPDIIYNEHYVWEDGSKGAYMLYYSASSTYCRSCIGFAVSKTIESGYQYVNTVIYSGFTNVDAFDENSTHNKHVKHTNVYEAYGTDNLAAINQNYFNGDAYNTYDFPNAIDPSLFFDEDGKLWMTYGSWSGGIWIIEMDPATGLAIHDEEINMATNNFTDTYFGKRIAYGNALSGEGPYIRYDEETGYYWLFTSIGWLASDGGYNIRMFRSEHPDGPYVDATGKAGTAMGGDNNSVGVKVMGGYSLPSLKNGYLSPGHNSFLIEDGKYYIVYHTRLEYSGEGHNVRVHQMFLNEDNWLCTMPFQYNKETLSENGYKQDELVGIYHVLNHGTGTNTTANASVSYIFTEDGKIVRTDNTSRMVGTWEVQEGTSYVTIKILNVEYKGVICDMVDEAGNDVTVMSAVGLNNASLWAVTYK